MHHLVNSDIAQQIKSLREKGVLIIGSGNIVHNLRMVEWKRLNETFGFDWAIEANEKMKKFTLNGDHQQLINFRSQARRLTWPFQLPNIIYLYCIRWHCRIKVKK